MRLINYLTELFDTKIKIKLIGSKKNSYGYQFYINNILYDVDIYLFNDYWKVEFSTNGIETLTGSGNAFEVFSGVIKCIEDFVKVEKPTSDIKIESPIDEPSRVKLYDKLSKTKSKEFGYKLKTKRKFNTFMKYRFEKLKND